MTDLYNFRGAWATGEVKGPVFVLDDDDEVDSDATEVTGKWLLTAELYVTGGGKERCMVS